MRILFAALLAVAAMVAVPTASAQQNSTTFVSFMSGIEEVPPCADFGLGALGFAGFRVNPNNGAVRYVVITTALPGTVIAGHIHVGPLGVAGPIVQPLRVVIGSTGLAVASGTFVNPGLVATLFDNPEAYYVNIHTTTCPAGAVRGQLESTLD